MKTQADISGKKTKTKAKQAQPVMEAQPELPLTKKMATFDVASLPNNVSASSRKSRRDYVFWDLLAVVQLRPEATDKALGDELGEAQSKVNTLRRLAKLPPHVFDSLRDTYFDDYSVVRRVVNRWPKVAGSRELDQFGGDADKATRKMQQILSGIQEEQYGKAEYRARKDLVKGAQPADAVLTPITGTNAQQAFTGLLKGVIADPSERARAVRLLVALVNDLSNPKVGQLPEATVAAVLATVFPPI